MLSDRPLHPTMWIRMWFADEEKLHQRGYTLVDPNPQADTVDIEFALHGLAAGDQLASHAIGDVPARVFLEAGYDDDKQLPVARSADVVWVDRKNAGEALLQAVSSSASAPPIISAGSPVTIGPPARWPRCSARITKSRANRLRRRHIGWPERHRQPSWKVSCSYQAVAST